jgi:hypothetical protein
MGVFDYVRGLLGAQQLQDKTPRSIHGVCDPVVNLSSTRTLGFYPGHEDFNLEAHL